jgi:thiol-disulfide isomerase/thioredoxin
MSIKRYVQISAVATSILMYCLPAVAFEAKAFDAGAFEAAQAAGKPVRLEINAPWCPTCRAQRPILQKLGGEQKFASVVAFTIDFDSQKDLLRRFNVRVQSTLISFRGRKEVARSTGETSSAAIEAQLDKSI